MFTCSNPCRDGRNMQRCVWVSATNKLTTDGSLASERTSITSINSSVSSRCVVVHHGCCFSITIVSWLECLYSHCNVQHTCQSLTRHHWFTQLQHVCFLMHVYTYSENYFSQQLFYEISTSLNYYALFLPGWNFQHAWWHPFNSPFSRTTWVSWHQKG